MAIPYNLPPLPVSGVDFTIDDQFKGASAGQDRVIDSLHKSGWTLHRVYTEPNAMLPLPEVKFPAGRVYLFADDVAVVVQKANGRVVASLPTRAALRTLHELTPEVIAENPWADEQWKEIQALDDDFGPHRRHHRQNFFLASGARVTVEKTQNGLVAISTDGTVTHTVVDDVEAEKLDLHPVVIELVAYIVENP